MKKCEECGRPLKEDEKKYCPRCYENKAQKTKGSLKLGVIAVAIIGAVLKKGFDLIRKS